VILRCLTCSRVAAETGRQQWGDHSLSNINTGIRGRFHFDHLCPVRSHYDRGASRGGLCHCCCCWNC
jgi:hypothetical protein